MIPLSRRAAHKNIETTLLSCSKQASSSSSRLPRPARYTTPSKPANALASLAHAPLPSYDPTPVYHTVSSGYTFMPTPLPEDSRTPTDAFFPDTHFQDLLAVMNACLHNCYDVRRALQIFDEVRTKHATHPRVDARLYNRVIAGCLDMAEREPLKTVLWVEDAYEFLEALNDRADGVQPDATTYALALRAWLRFGADHTSPEYVDSDRTPTPSAILDGILSNEINVEDVISDRSVPDDGMAAEMTRTLIKAAAADDKYRDVAARLVRAETVARHLSPDALESVPGVRPVRVDTAVLDEVGNPTGETTSDMPFNLKVLREHLSNVELFRRILPEDQTARQLLLERSVLDIASERLRKMAESFEKLNIPADLKDANIQGWMWDWHQKLVERLKRDIRQTRREEECITNSAADQRGRVAPFLELLKVEKLSLITILEIMRLHGTGGIADGMKTARALLAVGKAVETEYKAEMCRKHRISVPTMGPRFGESGFSRFSYQDLHQRRIAARVHMEDAEEWKDEWSQMVRVRVGAFLVYRLIEMAKVTRVGYNKITGKEIREEHPAFSHGYEYFRGFKLGTIKINPIVSERIAKDSIRDTLHPRHLPMLVEPKPWTEWNNGGYFTIPSQIMRFKESMEQKALLKKAISENNMEEVFLGLNVLGATPWRINRDIFDVVLKVWNSGERMGKIPPAEFDAPQPEKADMVDIDPNARTTYLARMSKWTQDKAANHSERCSVNYKIEIARAFLNDVFYLPHNLDFRGRAYPLPPHLNHMGNDLSRGLLLFAKGKPLGERGLRWLKIHIANLYGYDKATFDERVRFVDEHIEDIRDSAVNPLDGKGWWQKADDPWQCLATCMQLNAALNSPDPLQYECPLPVHQDGTCNGLQHYAALGGDSRGARQVNLDVGERPSDVYTYVANMVEKRIESDLQSKVKNDRKFAELLQGKVARKVVKQTVMTTVYGVTFVGAREQIEKQLRDRGDIPAEEVYLAAAYLAKKVMQCIGDLFSGANEIMTWLTHSARIIAKSVPGDRVAHALRMEEPSGTWKDVKKKPITSRVRKEQMGAVIWTTLMGLPIAQPYRKIKRKQIQTSIQSIYISDPNSPAEVNSQKQATAFPPNFIHSLDATHMLKTAIECNYRGLMFAAVHDSYWTHACDIDEMSNIIRDTFIDLHSSNVLKRLDDEFRVRYANHKVPIMSFRAAKVLREMGISVAEANETLMAASDSQMNELEGNAELVLSDLAPVKNNTEPAVDGASSDVPAVDEDGTEDLAQSEMSADEDEVTDVLAVNDRTSRQEIGEMLKPKRRGRKAKDDLANDVTLRGKFVNLIDLLPPLPKKGEFDVTKIKQSLYFFS